MSTDVGVNLCHPNTLFAPVFAPHHKYNLGPVLTRSLRCRAVYPCLLYYPTHRPSQDEAEGSMYSTSDLTRPEYSTDDFRMFNFKVRCGAA